VEVAKAIGIPCQSYMALSEGKFLDAQAGAETFASALLAAMAGINSVSGPGMLDYVLTFSLPKLVFDNEVCGQALHFVRPVAPKGDLPVDELVSQVLGDSHLLTSEHTLSHWPEELYLPSAIIDRDNRETWANKGSKDLPTRASEEVERRLAAYQPIETDPAHVAEMEALVRSGLVSQTELPPVASAPQPGPAPTEGRRRNRRGREQDRTYPPG
jgi:trimethylamine--corrinoid protein Co-methyltransferase